MGAERLDRAVGVDVVVVEEDEVRAGRFRDQPRAGRVAEVVVLVQVDQDLVGAAARVDGPFERLAPLRGDDDADADGQKGLPESWSSMMSAATASPFIFESRSAAGA